MTNYALLNNDDHQDVCVITERSARYGDNVMYALTFPFEFRSVQALYPILFHSDSNGNPFPVALFGFQEGENLFLDESGWDARSATRAPRTRKMTTRPGYCHWIWIIRG